MSGATAEVTEDALLGGRARLRQPRIGYRAGLDAALLAAACHAEPGERVIDVGCGPGGVLVQAAARHLETCFTGVERERSATALARENLALNGLADRAEIVEADVSAGFRSLGLRPFDAALCNPPFFDDPDALRAPRPERAAAWMADDGLATWTAFLLKAVREGGRITLIHRADRLPDLLRLLAEKAGSFQVRPVHPFADVPAKRVLVRCIKTGRAPFRLLPPLILHERGGARHTPEVEAILRGEAALPWS